MQLISRDVAGARESKRDGYLRFLVRGLINCQMLARDDQRSESFRKTTFPTHNDVCG